MDNPLAQDAPHHDSILEGQIAQYKPLWELLQHPGDFETHVTKRVLAYLGSGTLLPRAEWTDARSPAPTEARWRNEHAAELIAAFGPNRLTDFTTATVCRKWGQIRRGILARHVAGIVARPSPSYQQARAFYNLPPLAGPADRAQHPTLPPAVTVSGFRWNNDHQGFGNRDLDANGLYTLAHVQDGRPVYERYCMAPKEGVDDDDEVRHTYWIEWSTHGGNDEDGGSESGRDWLLRVNYSSGHVLCLTGVPGSADDVLPPSEWPYTAPGAPRNGGYYNEHQMDSTNHVRNGAGPMRLTFHRDEAL